MTGSNKTNQGKINFLKIKIKIGKNSKLAKKSEQVDLRLGTHVQD